ncbi:hypothetical protein niasHT_008938 [Heterodera trifolii]|uniref:Uncharacterized protein n=1 Tax=Heterodera trifolii TaxID=157864 RepID=A0ABD2LYA6_9BILA
MEGNPNTDTFDIRIAIIGKLDQLMDKEKTENNKSLIIATVLDPRFKLKLFEQMKEQIREWMRVDLQKIFSGFLNTTLVRQSSTSSSCSAEKPVFSGLLESSSGSSNLSITDDQSKSQNEFYDALHQMDKYLREPRVKYSVDPFQWWKKNEAEFSGLGRLMKKYHIDENATGQIVSKTDAVSCANCLIEKANNEKIQLKNTYSNCWDVAACHPNLLISNSASINAPLNKSQQLLKSNIFTHCRCDFGNFARLCSVNISANASLPGLFPCVSLFWPGQMEAMRLTDLNQPNFEFLVAAGILPPPVKQEQQEEEANDQSNISAHIKHPF